MREIDFGLDFVRLARAACGFRWARLRFGGRAEMCADLLCFVIFDGARVRLFLGDADFGQNVKNRLALDFQFPGQIVDTNLTHPPFLCSAPAP
jgi:hypothetical protein